MLSDEQISELRSHFPILQEKTYLYNCSQGALGLALALVVALLDPNGAYVYLFGISLFGGLFVWTMIFITHLYFRPKWDASGRPRLPVRMAGYPYTSLLGMAAIVAIIATTWWIAEMRVTIIAGLPWLGVLTAAYFLVRRRRGTRVEG